VRGGGSKASEHLHVTQTALTRRFLKLESYLGLRLLDRTTRHVETTWVGWENLPQAKCIVGDVTRAVERLKDMCSHGSGNFTLACIPTMTSWKLPEAIRRYSLSHPGNRLRILDDNGFEVRDAILQGRAELGIGLSTDRHQQREQIKLFEEPYRFFCPAIKPEEACRNVPCSKTDR
jgi:DNA-binding transcriptional LysR family regulator